MPVVIPNISVVSATKKTLVIAWGAVESLVARYEVRIASGATIPVGQSTSYRFTGLTEDTTYTVEVRAVELIESVETPSAWLALTSSTLADLRFHYSKSIRDHAGDLIPDCIVSLLEPGTSNPFASPVYVSARGGDTKGSVFPATKGIIDFYLDDPALLDVSIVVPTEPMPRVFPHEQIGDLTGIDPANDYSMAAVEGDPDSVFRTQLDTRLDSRYGSGGGGFVLPPNTEFVEGNLRSGALNEADFRDGFEIGTTPADGPMVRISTADGTQLATLTPSEVATSHTREELTYDGPLTVIDSVSISGSAITIQSFNDIGSENAQTGERLDLTPWGVESMVNPSSGEFENHSLGWGVLARLTGYGTSSATHDLDSSASLSFSQHPWTPSGPQSATVTRVGENQIALAGALASGAIEANAVVGSVPAEYAPDRGVQLIAHVAPSLTPVMLAIDSDGQITCVTAVATGATSLLLEGLTYMQRDWASPPT